MTRLFQFRRHKDDTWVDYHTRTCNLAREIWTKMGLPFLCERITENTWRAMGWVCDERPNDPAIFALNHPRAILHVAQLCRDPLVSGKQSWVRDRCLRQHFALAVQVLSPLRQRSPRTWTVSNCPWTRRSQQPCIHNTFTSPKTRVSAFVARCSIEQLQLTPQWLRPSWRQPVAPKQAHVLPRTILSKPLHQQPNVHARVRSNSLRHHFDAYQCDDTIFFSRFEPEDCMRTFSQSEPTRLQHRRHRIQATVSLVLCSTLLKTVPTHFTHDGTQRRPWATKTASPRPLANRNLPLTFFRENLQDCMSRSTSRPSVVLAPIWLCMPKFVNFGSILAFKNWRFLRASKLLPNGSPIFPRFCYALPSTITVLTLDRSQTANLLPPSLTRLIPPSLRVLSSWLRESKCPTWSCSPVIMFLKAPPNVNPSAWSTAFTPFLLSFLNACNLACGGLQVANVAVYLHVKVRCKVLLSPCRRSCPCSSLSPSCLCPCSFFRNTTETTQTHRDKERPNVLPTQFWHAPNIALRPSDWPVAPA